MKTPFLNYDASRKYLVEAMQLDDRSWELWGNLATLSYLYNDFIAGARQLHHAAELHHGSLNIDDRSAMPYLKEALDHAAGRTSCAAFASNELEYYSGEVGRVDQSGLHPN